MVEVWSLHDTFTAQRRLTSDVAGIIQYNSLRLIGYLKYNNSICQYSFSIGGLWMPFHMTENLQAQRARYILMYYNA